jgi:hypothetical protein
MRFDNPIYDHGFIFPDLSDFPDVQNEFRLNDYDPAGLDIIRNSIKTKNLSEFRSGYMKYVKVKDDVLFSKLEHMFNFYSRFKNTRVKMNDISSNNIYEDLYEDGIAFLDLNIEKLKKRVLPFAEKLLETPDWRPPPGKFDRFQQLDNSFKSEVHKIFEKSGIINAASKYNKGGRKLRVANVVLHIATPTDQNWKQFLYDCKTITKTINTHIDPKEDVMKAMIYLNDVDEDSGPFSYVKKSNRWIYDQSQEIFGRSVTTASYCCDPKSRSAIFQFPKPLRVSYNFGRLLLDNTVEQNRILQDQTVFTNSLGNLCVFDPSGIHRGGVCNTKIRIALQVLMK